MSPRTKIDDRLALPAGVTLPIVALGADGTAVLEDGSFVHVLACYPRNFDTFSEMDRHSSFLNFRLLASSLKAGQVLQINVEGDIVKTESEMAFADRETELMFGFRPSLVSPRDLPGLTEQQRVRWGIYQMMYESLRRACPSEGWAPCRRLYIITRYQPDEEEKEESVRRFMPGFLPGSERRLDTRIQTARSGRRNGRHPERTVQEHADMARRAMRHANSLRSLLLREGTASAILDGAAVLRYVKARLNPSSKTWAALEEEAIPGDVLSRFDSVTEHKEASEVAARLRDSIARSPLDFRRDLFHGEIEQDLVRTLYFTGQPSSTATFWLGQLLNHAVPFTLSVFLHGMDRLAVQDKAQREYHQAVREVERAAEKGKRDAATMRTAEDRRELVDDMARDSQAGLAQMSIYLSLRAPGTMNRGRQALADAVEIAQHNTQTATLGGRLDLGHRRQESLWLSTLPFADNRAEQLMCVGLEHAADSIPLIGATFGSPSGLPLFVSASGEVQYFQPFDRAHQNATMVITGVSGSGKTMFANRLVAWAVALGARGVVFDRAGHYEFLASLIPGSRVVRLGADGEDAINPWDVPNVEHVPREKIQFLVELHRVLLARPVSKSEERILAEAIRKTYGYCAREGKVPREGELVQLLMDSADLLSRKPHQQHLHAITSQLALELSEYAGSGIHAGVWDRLTTVGGDPQLIIVDYSSVAAGALPAVIFKMMEWTRAYVQRIDREAQTVEHSGAFHGRSIVLLDESHSWTRVPEAAHEVQTWARQARHWGTWFLVLSQDSADFQGDAQPVLTNASHRVFFRQDAGMLEFLRDNLSLDESVIRRMEQMRKNEGEYSEAYVVNGGRGSGFVRMIISATEHWAFTSNAANGDVAKRKRMVLKHKGNAWAAIAELARVEGIPTVDAGTIA